MFEDLPGLSFLLSFIALCPAAVVWWRGRVLVRHVDDPAFPERWEAERRRNGSTTVLAVAVLIVASPGSIEWTLPLLAVAYVGASYPLRKALYAETWTLGGYLSFVCRISAVVWGFWLILALLPTMVGLAGVYDQVVAVAATALLLIWNSHSDLVLRRALRTRPVADAALLERFSAVVQRSHIIKPRFEWIPLNGGVISNALALPSASGNPSRPSSVLFTETLLAQMDPDEATAICAHEIAHLEHYTPQLMRQYKYVNAMLVVTGAFLGILPRLAGWQSSIFASVMWLVALVGIMTWRVRNRQKNETASDLRGVELCGDAEALIRGLNKFYTFARMPRRLAVDVERHATHPSVARRIRDIRAATGAAPAALSEPASFTAADGRSTVTFVADRLQWTEGDVASHSLVYDQFSELRLEVMPRGGTSLLAVERSGRKWHVAIGPADVTRLQAVLDVVDGRLGAPLGSASHVAFARMARVTAAFAAAFAVTLGQLAMAVAALLAVLLPRAPLLAGAGAAAVASALVTARLYAHAGFDGQIGIAAMLTVVGILLLAGAYSRRHDEIPPRTMIGVTVLGICTVFWCGLLVANGLNPVNLHLSAVAVPSAAVLLFASSTTLACLRTRLLRYAAAPIGLAGMVALMAGSPWFLDLFGRDPFLGPAQPFTWRTISGSLQGEIKAPFYASTVHVSPSARAVIVSAIDDEDETATPRFHIARPGGPLVPNDADDLVFVDDDHVLGIYDGTDD